MGQRGGLTCRSPQRAPAHPQCSAGPIHMPHFLMPDSLYVFLMSGKSKLLQMASGEGDGTLLQYSCLENPMDGGAG